VGEFFFRAYALRHVAVDDDQFLYFSALVLDSAGGRFQNSPAAVLVTQTVLQVFAHARGTSFARRLQNLEAIIGMNLFENRSLGQLSRRVAQHTLIGRAVVESPPLGVDQRNHVGGVLRNDAK